ncbi:DUF2905 domain-containing protein [bacterium]|nr:DUF2905 domain-containing protein [bacterium]
MQKILILSGVILLIIGLFWPVLSKLPIGRLPGDIAIEKPGIKIYIPVMTMISISIILSVLIRLFRR